MEIYSNHIGYFSGTPIQMILHTEKEEGTCLCCTLEHGKEMWQWEESPKTFYRESWAPGYYVRLDLSERIKEPGRYTITVELPERTENSRPIIREFEVGSLFLPLRMINAMRCYFKGERASGEWLKADRKLGLAICGGEKDEEKDEEKDGEKDGEKNGEKDDVKDSAKEREVIDLHGGWYDAAGDLGIHLTQLSHTGKYNPVQSLLVGWSCFRAAERLESRGCSDARILYRELLDEGYWGADYAVRLKKEGESFYRSVDRGEAFSKEQKRKIDFAYFHHSGHEEDESYRDETITSYHYQVGFRGGAGIAVAVLAQAARLGAASGEYTASKYQETAEEAFVYLSKNNHRYLSDGKWNLLDWTEMLIAALELYRLTGEGVYLESCRTAEEQLRGYLRETKAGKWFVHSDGEYFFHPSDEGMPLLALAEYIGTEPERVRRECTKQELKDCLSHLLAVSGNTFEYAGFIRMEKGHERIRLFFPHDTEAAPWWQGENARIASLAAAVLASCEVLGETREYRKFAAAQLNWIMGENPFDSCMIEGYGRNNIQYFYEGHYDFINSPGGICNGITAGSADGEGIEFITEPSAECMDNWRWAEQWLPHAGWFLCAVSYLAE